MVEIVLVDSLKSKDGLSRLRKTAVYLYVQSLCLPGTSEPHPKLEGYALGLEAKLRKQRRRGRSSFTTEDEEFRHAWLVVVEVVKHSVAGYGGSNHMPEQSGR